MPTFEGDKLIAFTHFIAQCECDEAFYMSYTDQL